MLTFILDAIMVSSIITWLHNSYFDYKLPDYLGIFQGSAFIVILGFFVILPVAFSTALIWPHIQNVFINLQDFMASAGAFGVWLHCKS